MGPGVPWKDARSGPLEPVLLASSQLKSPKQRSLPSLLAMRVKDVRLKGLRTAEGRGGLVEEYNQKCTRSLHSVGRIQGHSPISYQQSSR